MQSVGFLGKVRISIELLISFPSLSTLEKVALVVPTAHLCCMCEISGAEGLESL